MSTLKSILNIGSIFIMFFIANINSSLSAQTFASGAGTENDPYVISTVDHLNEVRIALDSHYKLGADIDLDAWINTNSPTTGWTPLGSSASPFTGSFDGDGHVISGIWSTQNGNNVGLFGVISGEVSIKKLGIIVSEGRKMKGTENVGILAGVATNVPSGTKDITIDQVYVSGTVEATSKYVGGILGYNNWMHISITNCYAIGSVLSGGNGTGGLLGNSWGAVRILIDKCYAFNDITCNEGSAGGLAGGMSATSVENLNITISNSVSMNKSIKVPTTSVGRIYGWVKDDKITLTNNMAFYGVLVNGSSVSGSSNSIHGLDKTEEELAQQATYSAWDFASYWQMGNASYQLPVLKNVSLTKQPIEEVDLELQDDNPFKDMVDMYGTLNIVDQCGANSNGRFDNTEIIQQAIDACSAKKATLIFPAGRYFTRPIFLKSNMTLNLLEGSVILGSTKLQDYNDAFPGAGQIETSALVYGRDIANVKIIGKGKIDGRGGSSEFMLGNGVPGRPKVLHMIRCKNITVEDIELTNSAFWTAHFLMCDTVKIKGIKIYSHTNWNNDGLDIDSKNVEIEDCYIDCDDDGICMKSDRAAICENVTVKNCTIRTNCSAIKFGTAGKSGFKNISYSNCTILKASEDNFRKWHENSKLSWLGIDSSPSVIAGIALESVDGGILDGVNISDITMEDVHSAIFIRLGDRARSSDGKISQLSNVNISNIKAKTVSKLANAIVGVPGGIIENVVIKDVEMELLGGGTLANAQASVPEKADSYPENNMFGIVLPAYSFYVRHAKGITFDNVNATLIDSDARPEYVFDDVTDYEVITSSIENNNDDNQISIEQIGSEIQVSSTLTGSIQIQLIDLTGSVIYSSGKTIVDSNEKASIQKPMEGTYLLTVASDKGTLVKKIIVK